MPQPRTTCPCLKIGVPCLLANKSVGSLSWLDDDNGQAVPAVRRTGGRHGSRRGFPTSRQPLGSQRGALSALAGVAGCGCGGRHSWHHRRGAGLDAAPAPLRGCARERIATATLLPERPPRRHLEDDLQRQVVAFLRLALPADAVFYHPANGGQRHKKAAARMVGLGLVAGIPDLALICAGRPIFVELKTPRGQLSVAQRSIHGKLRYCGADVLVCRSVEGVANALAELGVHLRGTVAA